MAMLLIGACQYIDDSYDINRDILLFIIGSVFFTMLFRALFRGEKDTSSVNANSDINKY